MQVVKYFLCVRDIGEKYLNRLLDCYCCLSEKQSPEAFCKKGAFKNFANLTGKPVLESVFDKVVGPWTYNFLKKRL